MKYNLFKVSAFSACIFNVSFAAFHKDALVSTSDGPVPMDLIRPGHMVLAYSPRLGSTGFSIVQAKNMASNNGFMVDINVVDRVIHAMPGQLLFDVASNSFVKARRLTSRHILFGEDSSLINIQDVKIRRRSSFSTPNEITVGNDHTLFVDGVLNHNLMRWIGLVVAGAGLKRYGADPIFDRVDDAVAGASRAANARQQEIVSSGDPFIDINQGLRNPLGGNKKFVPHYIRIGPKSHSSSIDQRIPAHLPQSNQLPHQNQYSVAQARPASQSQSLNMHPGYVDIYRGPGSFYHNPKPVDGEISHAERVKARHKEVDDAPVKDHEKAVDRSQPRARRQAKPGEEHSPIRPEELEPNLRHFENSAEGKRLKAMRERHDAGLPTLPEHKGRYKEENNAPVNKKVRKVSSEDASREKVQQPSIFTPVEQHKSVVIEQPWKSSFTKERIAKGHLLPTIKIQIPTPEIAELPSHIAVYSVTKSHVAAQRSHSEVRRRVEQQNKYDSSINYERTVKARQRIDEARSRRKK